MKARFHGLQIATLTLAMSCSWAVVAGETPLVVAQATTAAAPPGEEQEQTVIVTGSRIPTVLTEGPSPVTTITRDQIESRGFSTVLEAATSLTQITGVAQNETDANGFTTNAGAIDLRALGPGRTLILLDGRRITDYPLPYNSESNFVNLSAIPAAAVERIELLAGGASAVYGSDAVAGVVNIVLRKDIDTPLDMNLRFGDTTQGGGQSTRFQGVGGWHTDTFRLIYAAEYLKREPLFGLDRNFMDSVEDNPDPAGRINPRALLVNDPFDLDGDGNRYVDPGSAACSPFANMVYSTRAGGFGNYCGQPNDPAQASIRNKSDRVSLYTRAEWNLEAGNLYTTFNIFKSRSFTDPNFSWWTTTLDNPYIFNTATDPYGLGGTVESLQRFFQTDEIGGRKGRENRFDERSFDVAAGFTGKIGSSSWTYDASLGTSHYRVLSRQRQLLGEAVSNYFLGPFLGFTDLDPSIPPIATYNYDVANFYQPLTPEIWNSLTDDNRQVAHSENNVAQVVLNGELFALPAGRVQMAAVAEYAKQKYNIATDPRLLAGEFWGSRGTGGGGERKRAAAGVEFRIPILSMLDAQLAGRYDDYNDITSVNSAISYNAGLEFRPIRQLLLRGSYATSFRAPDMHYIFAQPSGFFTQGTDEFLCRRDEPGVPLAQCTQFVAFEGERAGNPNLEEEKGHSYTLGLVAEPFQGFTFKADYYHIKLTGAVLDNPLERILELEADCRLGTTTGGVSVDINSAQCQDAISRVQRLPVDGTLTSEALDVVTTGPINSANIITSGIDASIGYRWVPVAPIGSFDFGLGWSHVLKFDERDFAGDPLDDRRDNLQIFDWRSRVNASITWAFRRVSLTAYGERFGSLPNWAETGRIKAVSYMNLSGNYSFMDDHAAVGIFVNNVFDRNPPRDPTFDQYPYYSNDNYSAIGREVFVQLRYNFGARK